MQNIITELTFNSFNEHCINKIYNYVLKQKDGFATGSKEEFILTADTIALNALRNQDIFSTERKLNLIKIILKLNRI